MHLGIYLPVRSSIIIYFSVLRVCAYGNQKCKSNPVLVSDAIMEQIKLEFENVIPSSSSWSASVIEALAILFHWSLGISLLARTLID